MYYAYIFQCETLDRFDVGVTEDLDRQLREHALEIGSDPRQLRVFSEAYDTRLEAEERELRMKSWSRPVMIEALDH